MYRFIKQSGLFKYPEQVVHSDVTITNEYCSNVEISKLYLKPGDITTLHVT